MVAPAGRDGERRGGRLALTGRSLAAASVGALGFILAGGTAHAQDVVGTWLTEAGTSQVRIAPCGAGRCGTIVWTRGDAKDVNNPDPARRPNRLGGLQMIRDARPSGDGWMGALYNPLDGRTYTGRMRLLAPDRLELSGCVLAGLICKSQTWTRVR